jgi:hypothetical protein
MRRCGRASRCLEPKHRADTAAFPLWIQFRRIIVWLTLVLFSSYTVQAEAYLIIRIDKLTEIFSAKRVNPHDPYLLDPSPVNSTGTRAQVDHPTCKTAEQLYEAASADARTLERAIFLSALRREVERALGKAMTDDELRTLADQAREEAHRWYKYIQSDHRCAASWHGEWAPSRPYRPTSRV